MQQWASPVPLPGAHPPPQAPGKQSQAALNVILLCPQAHPPQDPCHAQCCRQQAVRAMLTCMRAHRQPMAHGGVQ